MKSRAPLKCIFAIFLIAILAVSGFTLAFAEEETVSGFSFSTSLDTSGKTIDLIINLDENSGLQCARYAVQYDPEKLKLVNFENGELFPGDWAIEKSEGADGVWNPENKEKFLGLWVMASNDSSNPINYQTGLFAKYSFQLTEAAELGDVLEIKVVDMEGGREIPGRDDNVYGNLAVTNNATYTVTGYNVTGTITTPATSTTTKPLEGALVEILDGDTVIKSATTDENGAFSIPAVPGGEYVIRISKDNYVLINDTVNVESGFESYDVSMPILGDVNEDGRVNSTDLQRLYTHLQGTNVLKRVVLGDINGDGRVNSTDLQRLYTHLQGTNLLY